MGSKKTLYLFDFDGTLTSKDSLFDFLKFCASPVVFYLKFFLFLPEFVFAILGYRKNAEVKEKFIASFLKGKTRDELNFLATNYANTFDRIVRPKAKELLDKVKKNPENECYIVSASLDIWLNPIAKKLQIKLICTQAEYENGIFTGKFSSLNCNHSEKKRRISEEIDLKKYEKIIAFGDSKGDKQMFSLANEVYFKPFRD